MAALKGAKTQAQFSQSKELVYVTYDFSVDAGATGALDLMTAASALVITDAKIFVDTACTSAGSATVSVGKSGDAAGIVAATAVASLTAGASIDSVAGAENYKLAAGDVVQVAIAVAALTAGKFRIVLECLAF